MANIELDGLNKKIKVDSGDLTLDVPGDIVLDADGGDITFADGGTNLLKITNSSSDVVFQPQVDTKDIVFKQYDGTVVATVEDNATFNVPTGKLAINGTAITSTAAELNILDGVTATAAELNLIDGVTATTAELNILDGVTATAAEINLIDGGTARGTTAIADGDGVLINDAGTMRQTTVETLKTYIGSFNADAAQVFNESGADADFRIEADDTTHMFFVDASEDKIGINQSAPQATLQIRNGGSDYGGTISSDASNLCLENSGNAGMTIASGTSHTGSIYFGDSGSADIGQLQYNHNGNYMMFRANNGERMRITSDGDLIIGGTALSAEGALSIEPNASNGAAKLTFNRASSNGGNTAIIQEFKHGNSLVGKISHDQGDTVYTTTSDYRLKENVTYNFDATTRLKQLKPARFNFIIDETNTLRDGFIAHEVSNVVPRAVVGEKDAVDSEGNIEPQTIDQSKLVPLLVKTVQELEARIKTLEDA